MNLNSGGVLPSSAVAVHLGGLRALAEAGALVRVEQAGIVVQALGHLVADDVHKALEHSLQMDAFKILRLSTTPP